MAAGVEADADALFDQIMADAPDAGAADIPALAKPEEEESSEYESEGEGEGEDDDGDVCAMCKEGIEGPLINACGKVFHPEHYVCNHCKEPFPGGQYFEGNDGMPYCEQDFQALFGSVCSGCNEHIVGRCINALDKKWHPDCFVCFECKQSLAGGSFVDFEGDAHCKPCAREKKKKKIKPLGPVCARCKETIEGEYITLQGQKMHPYHFSCHKCKCSFKGTQCHEYEGNLYCETHYRELLAAQCAQCRRPITGRAITALGKQWHPEHFCCAYCEQPFGGNNFHVQAGKPYCEQHFIQLFGNVCHWCRKPAGNDGVHALDKVFHRDHFLCTCCCSPMGSKLYSWEGKPMCKRCYDKLPKDVKTRLRKVNAAEAKAAKAAARS